MLCSTKSAGQVNRQVRPLLSDTWKHSLISENEISVITVSQIITVIVFDQIKTGWFWYLYTLQQTLEHCWKATLKMPKWSQQRCNPQDTQILTDTAHNTLKATMEKSLAAHYYLWNSSWEAFNFHSTACINVLGPANGKWSVTICCCECFLVRLSY